MSKKLTVALQVQADLKQAKREVHQLNDELKATSQVADQATAAQNKTAKSAKVTTEAVEKFAGINMRNGINQVKDYENWLNKTSVAATNAAKSNALIESSVKNLTPHLMTLIGLSGGFVAAAVDTVNKAAELKNLSFVTGMDVESFQYSAVGAKKMGIEIENFSDILQNARDKVGDYLAEGGGELAQFFDEIAPKVGVTAKQFEHLNGDQIMGLYVQTLQKAGVSQNEMVTHMERIASGSTRLAPLYADNAKLLNQYGTAAKDAGAILSQDLVNDALKAKSAMGELQQGIGGTINTLVANAAPAIVFVAENLDVLVRAGIVAATVFAGKMVASTAAATIAFIAGRIEAIKYQMALAQMAGIATTTAARLTALSAVSRMLTMAGGLPGLALAAAGVAASFLLMPSASDAATDSLEDQNKTVADLAAEYQRLDEAQQRIAVREAVSQQEDLTQAFKNQQTQLAHLVEMGTRASSVSDEQRKKALALVESYKKGEISAGQLTAEYQKLNTVKAAFRARADEVAVATDQAKAAMDRQNNIVDIYTGKATTATTASANFAGQLGAVGTQATSAMGQIQSLGKAYDDYVKKANSANYDNQMIAGFMQDGSSEKRARMISEMLNAKNANPNATQTYGALTSDELALIDAQLASEKALENITDQRKKQEEAITKEKEKQKKISEQSQKINSTVMAQAKKYNYEALENQYGLPKGLLASVSMQESRGNPNAVSPVGAKGAFQFMPKTAERFGLKDRTDVAASAEAAAKYLSILLKMFNGDLNKAIMAYNAGEGNVQNGRAYGFKETQKYLPSVKRYMAGYNGLDDENAQSTLQQIVQARQDFLSTQKQTQLNIDMRFATEAQKLKLEYDALIEQIKTAGYDQETLKTRLEQAEQEYQDKLTKRPEVLKRIYDSVQEIEGSWLEASGKTLEANLKNVEDKWKQPKADLAQLIMSEKDPTKAAEFQSMLVKIDFVIEKEQLTLQFNDAMKQLDELEALRKQRQETQKLKFESGQISQPQFAESLNIIDAEMVPQLQTIAEQARVIAEQLGDAFNVEKLNAFVVGLTQIDTEFKKFLPTAEQLNERIAGGLTDAIMDFADGTKSAGDAFRQFASDFLREIAQMILKQMMFNMVKSAMGSMGGIGGGIASAIGGAFAGFMQGGHTGYGRRDEVAGVVHRDEWVITKPRTNEPGAKEFLSYFERYGMKGLNKFNGYMNGGLVGAPSIAAPHMPTPKLSNPVAEIAQSSSFNANQNFYLVDDPSRILDTLTSSQGQENLVVMLSRDPAKFKSALKIG